MANIDGFHIRSKAEYERSDPYLSDRQRIADRRFGGDTTAVDSALQALPNSRVPGWVHLAEVMLVLEDVGVLRD